MKLGQPDPESNLASEGKTRRRRRHMISTVGVTVDVLAGESRLGAGLSKHTVLLRTEAVAPLVLGELHVASRLLSGR